MQTSAAPTPASAPASTLREFDHVIVGSGQATGVLLAGLPADERIAVIEGADVGGTCVNVGCTPTKTLVASARVAHLARRAAEYGVRVGEVAIDFAAVRERMNELRHDSREGLERLIEELPNATLIRGWARFVGPRTLAVGDETVRGARVYLNVGARARVPDIEGLGDVPWLDNARLLALDELPEHLVIVGASYVGLEFGQMFARFGSRVTVVGRGARIMPREDADVADAAREILEEEGLRFELDAEVTSVRPGPGGGVEVPLGAGGRGRSVAGSHLLVAAGRVPNSERLDLAAGGIDADDDGYVRVDDTLQTSAEGVYGLGDVNGEGAFTHTSANDAEIVLDALGGGPRRLSDRIPVYAVFIDPPLGRVGLSEREAKERGHRVLKATRQMSSISRAREMGETKGFVKLLVDADTDLILGGSVLGVNGDEIVNMLAAFMYGAQPCSTYRRAVLVHPTVGELMPWILDGLEEVE